MRKQFVFKLRQRVYTHSLIHVTKRPGTVIARYRHKNEGGAWHNVYVVRMDDLFRSNLHECDILCAVWAEDYLTSFKVLGEKPAFARI